VENPGVSQTSTIGLTMKFQIRSITWTGNECRQFEKEFTSFTDAEYAVAVSNGTVALDLALKA